MLFERTLTEAERARFDVVTSDEPVGAELSLGDVRSAFRAPEWHTVRAELIVRGEERHVRITRLGRDRKWLAAERTWKTGAGTRLMLGGDAGAFTHVRSNLGFVDVMRIYVEGVEWVGRAEEVFRSPSGNEIVADITESLDGPIALHDFLNAVIDQDFELLPTPYGPVLARAATHAKGNNEYLQPAWVAWMSGDHVVVFISGGDVRPLDLVALYGEKFPSTLPADLKVDRTAWGREAVDLTLRRLRSALDDDRPNQPDWFLFHLGRLSMHVFVPALQLEAAYSADAAGREAILDSFAAWWQQNEVNSVWDERRNLLVLSGQFSEGADPAREPPR